MNIIASVEPFEDMESEDNDLGPMPDETETVFQQLVRQLRADASSPCGSCGGSGGHIETTFDANGTRRDTWRSCGSCHGSGQA